MHSNFRHVFDLFHTYIWELSGDWPHGVKIYLQEIAGDFPSYPVKDSS